MLCYALQVKKEVSVFADTHPSLSRVHFRPEKVWHLKVAINLRYRGVAYSPSPRPSVNSLSKPTKRPMATTRISNIGPIEFQKVMPNASHPTWFWAETVLTTII